MFTLCTIKYIGTHGARIIYDRRNKPVRLGPGESKVAELDASTVRMLSQRRDPHIEISNAEAPAAAPAPAERTVRVSENEEIVDTPQSLIDGINDKTIEYRDAVARAKVLLGDKWPGGTPRKSTLLELLQDEV